MLIRPRPHSLGPRLRRARAGGLLVSALLATACADATPSILDVAVLQDTADPRGAFRFTAVVRPGDGATTARVRATTGEAADLDGPCGAPPGDGPWRNVDAGAPSADSPPCFTVRLRRAGERFTGDLVGPPFPLGTRLLYVVEAFDADDDAARWPAEGAAALIVGPAGRAPGLEAVAPARGPASGGTEVLLRGDGFAPDVEVLFGARPAAVVRVESAHLLVVAAPVGEPGAADVTVRRAGRATTLSAAYVYVPPPVVRRVSPAEGPTEAETLVVVEGRGFEPGATVAFAEQPPAEAVWLAADRLAAVAPPHAPGVGDVAVQNPDGQRGVAADAFTWWPPPRLDAIEPDRGPDTGGTRVTVRGADLRGPGAVYLGDGAGLDVTVAADGRSATFVSPLHAEGVVDVAFFNPDGQAATLGAAWRFVGPPVVTAAAPDAISRCGGGRLELIGRNFEPGLVVRVGGVEAEVLEVADDGTRVVVRAPPGRPGPARVEVINPDGRTYRADDLVSYGVVPSLDVIDVIEVPIWGGTAVEVGASDLETDAAVTVGGVPAEQVNFLETEACDQRLRVVVPPHPEGPADLVARNPDGVAASLPGVFAYVAPTLSPDHGLLPGYANVELRGVDLRAGLRIRFAGAAPRAVERVSDTQWRVLTPPGAQGPVAVEVRNADGRGAVLEQAFTYRALVDRTAGRLSPFGDCNDVSVADLDGDGDLDFVAANGAVGGIGQVEQPVGVHLNDGAASFRAQDLAPRGNGMNARLGDYDGDGDLDLLVANLSSARNNLFRNDGAGGFMAVRDFPGAGPSYDADLVDVDGDGDLDAFLLQTGAPEGGNQSGPEQLWLNEGGGRWLDASDRVAFDPGDVHDHDFEAGDLNGDGLPDIVIVVDNLSQSFQTARNRLLLNQGDGRFAFAPSPFDDFQGDWLHVELVDLDADGDLDVVLPQDYLEGFSRAGTPAIAVFLNDGRANFQAAHERIHGMPRVPAFESVTVDVDGDGDRDMLVAVYGILFSDGSVEPFRSVLLLNDGAGEFFEATTAFVSPATIASADFGVGDFDGDGDADLIECAARGQSRLWVQE